MRWLAIVPLAVAMALGAYAVQAYRGAVLYSKVFIYAAADAPHIALAANLEAVNVFPLPSIYRTQPTMLLAKVIEQYGDKVEVSSEAADAIDALAASAGPHSPSRLVPRAIYLVNTRRIDVGELDQIVERLKERATLLAETWAIDAAVALVTGDLERLARVDAETPEHMKSDVERIIKDATK